MSAMDMAACGDAGLAHETTVAVALFTLGYVLFLPRWRLLQRLGLMATVPKVNVAARRTARAQPAAAEGRPAAERVLEPAPASPVLMDPAVL
eukprot:CAMPEP_0168433056 /NCGR_PEP_ID=MMETSP0228-20121227/39204_1 /TAXON_ID=133427 /ORGANISM="Protoceratium reticulatum, Strain CCCM 535 (=CCMP 1889)" /LENGTH=91 /DNA_ID=CAMNT_0008447191 /DNA_START=167 /DNA_END=443 /DNA_ORIENTATION=-